MGAFIAPLMHPWWVYYPSTDPALRSIPDKQENSFGSNSCVTSLEWKESSNQCWNSDHIRSIQLLGQSECFSISNFPSPSFPSSLSLSLFLVLALLTLFSPFLSFFLPLSILLLFSIFFFLFTVSFFSDIHFAMSIPLQRQLLKKNEIKASTSI